MVEVLRQTRIELAVTEHGNSGRLAVTVIQSPGIALRDVPSRMLGEGCVPRSQHGTAKKRDAASPVYSPEIQAASKSPEDSDATRQQE